MIWSFILRSQSTNIGTPFTTNYPNEVYKAGTQNWDIQQHPNGFMFFANNNGLLEFDGTNWEVFPLANKTIARSLYITEAGRIYVGGQGEFGYFEPNEHGLLIFHSLESLIPKEHRNFADVWTTIAAQGNILFNASYKIFLYNGTTIKVIENGIIDFLGNVENKIFAKNENGLFSIEKEQISVINGGEKFSNSTVEKVLPFKKNSYLVATLDEGFFTLTDKGSLSFPTETAFFQQNKIHSAAQLNNGKIAVGTANAGLVIMNKHGRIIHKLDRNNGLQNNHLISVAKDQANNLWAGLNNGVDYIATNAPFTKLIPNQELEGTAYAAQIVNKRLYLGTSNGLYTQPWAEYYNPLNDVNFELIKGTEGQIWGLNPLNEKELFLGHHFGGFTIEGDNLSQISSELGNWKIIELNNFPKHYLMGTYNGLKLYKKEGKHWIFLKQFEEFKESCRIIEQDQTGNIWVAHPYRGIYKVNIQSNLIEIKVKLYGKKDGLPSNNLNHVFEINKEIVFTGEKGIYSYHPVSDTFEPYEAFFHLIGSESSIHRFFEDKIGNIWYATTDEIGILNINDKGISKSFSKQVLPELKNKLVRGFEYIYPYDEFNVFIGAEKGFIHYNPSLSKGNPTNNFTTNIVKVQTINSKDSTLIFGQYNASHQQLAKPLSFENNALRFSFTSTNFESKDDLQFATQLEGFDDDWSPWSQKPEKDFTNLNAGDYRFLVKAKSMHGQESTPAEFSFSISPPWYSSKEAIAIYTLLGLAFLSGLILIPRRKYQEEKAQLESAKIQQAIEHQQIMRQSEQKIMELKNKQLQTEIAHKNRELAMSTMHLVQRKELIQQIQNTIQKVAKSTKDESAASELRKINRLLQENAQLSEEWQQFAHYFDQVHNDFLQKLRRQYPQLSANDEKLCAYLRMNLTTKEMAPLMNISIRGVEVARYRLRKKLNLDSAINLNEFMLKF